MLLSTMAGTVTKGEGSRDLAALHGHLQPKTHMSNNIISSEQKRPCTL